MTTYASNLTIENDEDLAELADRVKDDGSRITGDSQADNNARAGRAATVVLEYLREFDQGEPIDTVIGDLLGDLRHLCDSLVNEDGERGVDFEYLVDRSRRDHDAEVLGVL